MKRVLVVDEEPELTTSSGSTCGTCYEDVVAHNGPAALAAANQKRPDTIFLDINIPGPSGLDVLRELQRADLTIVVIMVTVNTEVAVVQECLREARSPTCPSRST